MKPSHPAKPAAPTNYAPSVPMSVYRELAAELRANKAVIDSLNSRNQQLVQQNQFLKQEIHNVVQATLNLGQAAGVARQAAQEMGAQNFPREIAPDTLAKLVKAEVDAQTKASEAIRLENAYDATYDQQPTTALSQVAATQPIAKAIPRAPKSPSAAPPTPQNRVPRPIAPTNNPAAQAAANATAAKAVAKKQAAAKPKAASKPPRKQASKPTHAAAYRPTETIPGKGTLAQRPAGKPAAPAAGKLFTEQSGEYRSAALESEENKEIGGIWLALSIILIIVTAFGAGFLIMKPLLNDR
ncbi:MAG: hypothetical protein AAFP03_03710 [Cyanobacteria bacterium J06598_3]